MWSVSRARGTVGNVEIHCEPLVCRLTEFVRTLDTENRLQEIGESVKV